MNGDVTMVSEKELFLLDSLQPNERALVVSMMMNFSKNNTITPAQERFSEMRGKYSDTDMSMEEIDKIIHDGDSVCK
jgi:hypothetical protein